MSTFYADQKPKLNKTSNIRFKTKRYIYFWTHRLMPLCFNCVFLFLMCHSNTRHFSLVGIEQPI